MKIAMISESPSLTTGFGTTCNHIMQALTQVGHEVACFGINAFGETFDRSAFCCRIWSAGRSDNIALFAKFLAYEQPDLIFISFDIIAVKRWFHICETLGWTGPTVAYFVIDGIPVDHQHLDVLPRLKRALTPTQVVADYLTQSYGYDNVVVAPHGIDMNIFRPLPNRRQLRKLARLDDKFVVGVFGRNNERKQQPRTMMALQYLDGVGKSSGIFLYLHCQPEDDPKLGGWNLINTAKELDIEDKVLFPHHKFSQLHGVPWSLQVDTAMLGSDQLDNSLHMPRNFGYVERMNCCDFIINASFCGGFELSILEAQACGVPIAVTNDYGIMREVSGNGAFLLEASDKGIWRTGCYQYFVSPHTIADAITRMRTDTNLRNSLIQQGILNASHYSWDKLKMAAVDSCKV